MKKASQTKLQHLQPCINKALSNLLLKQKCVTALKQPLSVLCIVVFGVCLSASRELATSRESGVDSVRKFPKSLKQHVVDSSLNYLLIKGYHYKHRFTFRLFYDRTAGSPRSSERNPTYCLVLGLRRCEVLRPKAKRNASRC